MIGRRHRRGTATAQLRQLVEELAEVFPWWWWLIVAGILEVALIAHRLGRIATALEALIP